MLWFLLPLLLIGGFFESAFWMSGDSWPMAKIAAAHEGRTSLLVRPRYFAQSYRFKFDRLRSLRPDIVCLGTSRVLQIRALFFDTPRVQFYNCGGLLGSFADIHAYTVALADGRLPKPKIAIFGIEPWWMKSGLPPSQPTWDTDSQYADSFYIPEAHIAATRAVLKQWGIPWPGSLGHAFSPAPHSTYPSVGAAAISKGVGFRHDGSYQYDPGLIIRSATHAVYEDRETPPVIERLRSATEQFTPAADLDHEMLATLVADLKALRGMGVEAHVILPPWANECYEQLNKTPDVHGWWNAYKEVIPQTLRNAGFNCQGPSRPQDLGLQDTAMWDGFHPSEVFMARIIADLVRQAAPDSLLNKFISPKLDTLARFNEHPLTLEPAQFKP